MSLADAARTTSAEAAAAPDASAVVEARDAALRETTPPIAACFAKLLSTTPVEPCEDVADYALRPVRRVGAKVRLLGRLTIHDSRFAFLDPLDSQRDGEVNVHTWWGGDQPVCHEPTIVEVEGETDDPRFGITGLETISLPLRRVKILRSFADDANVICLGTAAKPH